MTVAELACSIGQTQRFTRELLADWDAAGIAVELGGSWRLTTYGLEAFGLPLLSSDPAASLVPAGETLE